MIINLLVFLAANVDRFFGAPQFIVNLFALQAATFLQHPWTIVTNMFTHIDLWHILLNMLSLYFLGSFLSKIIGYKKMLLVYFCGGIMGNIFFMLLAPSYSAGIGASGAIFALGGALAAIAPRLRVYIFPIPVAMPLWVSIIISFVILLPISQIAWQAHLGGLVFGLVSGFFFRKKQRLLF
jgi:membrane associated rhomboid family serine protease